MPHKDTVIVFSAHSDDFVIGAGGTIAKYAKEGKRVLVLVMSYGEKSHPWMKDEVTQKFRAEEAFNAADVLGCQVIFFNLIELKFLEDYKQKKLEHKIAEIINHEKPVKILTHSNEDPHPDHRATHNITRAVLKKIRFRPEVYQYAIWNPVSFRTPAVPRLYVNITPTFSRKIKALNQFPSQRFQVIYPLSLPIFFRNIITGLKIKTWVAEEFHLVQ